MISLYRQNNGLGAVVVDPELMKVAETQSQAMASSNKLDHDVKAPLAKRLECRRLSDDAGGRKCVGQVPIPWPRPFPAGATRRRTGKTC